MNEPELKFERHCFVCAKKIESAIDGSDALGMTDPANDATHWTTQGNYGSTLIDADGRTLEIIICDKCLRERAGYVLQYEHGLVTHKNVKSFCVDDQGHSDGT